MKHRTTIALLVVFFSGLIVLWWADYSKIPTEHERMRWSGLVLPPLLDLSVDQVKRVEIEGTAAGKLAFDRTGRDSWQMTAPLRVAADASMVDTLVRSLKDLRPVSGVDAQHGAPADYGLDHPAHTVRLFGGDAAKPLVTLAFGKSVDHQRYVQAAGSGEVQVIDGRWFGVLERPAVDWREKALFALSSFMVEGLAIKKPGGELEATRTGNQWRITRPHRCLADNAKIEGIVADAVALRVADGAKGYVADDVKDFARYGLDKPALVITLAAASSAGPPQTVEIGKPVPDVSDRAYARRADQDEVVLVDTKHLQDLKTDITSLRSQRVADVDLARVDYVQVTNEKREHALALSRQGWQVVSPSPGPADRQAVQALMNAIGGAEALEVFGPENVKQQKLDEPWLVLKMWQGSAQLAERGKAESKAAGAPQTPRSEPAFVLKLGRHDPVAKTVFAQVDDEPAVLALPEQILKVLPSGPLDLRDRNLLALSPGDFAWLEIRRGSTKYLLKPGSKAGDYSQWRMVKPVAAEADTQLVARLLVMLSNLRAESLVADDPDNLSQYGLDTPALSASWSTRAARRGRAAGAQAKSVAGEPELEPEFTLHVGKEVSAKTGSHYARLAQGSLVFTINAVAYGYLNAELHDRRVLSFTPDHVRRIVLRWPGKQASYARAEKPLGGFGEMAPEAGGTAGFTVDQVNLLLRQLSSLLAVRFEQYEGKIPAAAGLESPRLTIEAELVGKQAPLVLRLGNPSSGGTIQATNVAGDTGPVFLLSEAEWTEWLKPAATAPAAAELPPNPFAP